MDRNVSEIQQRLRERLSGRFAMSEASQKLPIVTFEQVVGLPAGAQNLVLDVSAQLKRRGYRVAVVSLAKPSEPLGGAETEGVPDASYRMHDGWMTVQRRVDREPGIDEALALLGEGPFDVILGEGFGYAPAPKFLVTDRPAEGFNLGLPNVVGYVSEKDERALIPRFSAIDAAGIADRVEEVLGLTRPNAPESIQTDKS